MFDFGREICSSPVILGGREWLVTNGIGGYASGTIAGFLTRCYHGLLVAALKPPLGRILLLTKLDETATYEGGVYPLFANCWRDFVDPVGFQHLERFHLEGTTPVWTYACADALLEKRVWMQPGANTTYIRYTLYRGTAPLKLSIKTLVNYRDHHLKTHAGNWRMHIDEVPYGLRVTAHEQATPFYLLSDLAEATLHHEWYLSFFLSEEKARGFDGLDDNLFAGIFEASLNPGESLTIMASTEMVSDRDRLKGASAYAERQAYEQQLIARSGLADAPTYVHQLVLAADQFIVHRALPEDINGRTVIAGYHWFSDWGRDTMISLPGLTINTGRSDVAACILRTFAHFVDKGMLPNRFPDEGEKPEYNTVDATLWYFEAVRAYYAATGDDKLLRELFPVLQDIIYWHQRGTRYQIQMDPTDGLLYAGELGVQLTWMDAKMGEWVVTPRIGKPVEINALWYNALCTMTSFANRLGKSADDYLNMTNRVQAGFKSFWNEDTGYCYDVIDGPDGNDPALRPNQIFAVSLPHSPISIEHQRAVVDTCARHLLTSHGLRSLSPDSPHYIGHYGGNQSQRDAAYHQGTVWGWLIGPFISAHLRVYGDRELARSFLQPLIHHMTDHCVGSVSEIFDGNPPFVPRGCIAQAWSVAELLRVWQETKR